MDGIGIVSCIELRLPRTATGQHPSGVPPGDEAGAYILNVVVHEEERGRGIGKRPMKAAMNRAVERSVEMCAGDGCRDHGFSDGDSKMVSEVLTQTDAAAYKATAGA